MRPKLSKLEKIIPLPESSEDLGGTLLYNLAIIKTGLQIIRLKTEANMDEKALSQFSKIERALFQMTEEILEYTILREKLTN